MHTNCIENCKFSLFIAHAVMHVITAERVYTFALSLLLFCLLYTFAVILHRRLFRFILHHFCDFALHILFKPT